jgi:hypothetical protein
VEMHQHLLVDQKLKGYSGTYYPRRSTLPETLLETNTGEALNETSY